MAVLKHTPGPWEVDINKTGIVRASKYVRIEQVFEVDNFISPLGEGEIIRQGEANAKLIAAAPDMLRELTNLVSYCNAIGGQFEYSQELKNAISTIKKATE